MLQAVNTPTQAPPAPSDNGPASSPVIPPQGFKLAFQQDVTVNGAPAVLTRYERGDGRNAGLGGEHFSTVTDRSGALKGLTRMVVETNRNDELPSQEQATKTALAFLQAHAADLVPTTEIHWVAPHGEVVKTSSGPVEITGMKVKMRNKADGLWMWVIVGPGNSVVTFERDILWISMPGRRGTEMWLHDAWLARQAQTNVRS